ncbi:MAG TPA: substrate-binding domain-containing protein [Steroidobacteraceae bacterium]|nr:substrate-binding domain-containing protein [Steroidobacteraceae bacterium]
MAKLQGPAGLAAAAAAASFCIASAAAADGGTAVAAPGGPLLEWLMPAAAHPAAQTAEEKARGMVAGRARPRPELLQPTLDPRLQRYVPRPDAAALRGRFRAAASDVLPDLAQRWIAAFEKIYPNVHIDLAPPYEGSLGAQKLAAGRLDIAFVSRELRPVDVAAFRAKFGHPPLSVPVCGGSWRHFGFLDAVGVIVNQANPIRRLSFAQLDAILSRTHFRGAAPVTAWGQLGLTGAWAKRPIHIYGVKPWNGFEEFVRERVLSTPGHRGAWRAGIRFSPTVFPIATQVAADPDGIGYSGLAFLDAPVKLLPLQRQAGEPYYAPTYGNVARAAYPLARLVYANVDKTAGKALDPALAEFLRFIVSREGQRQVLEQAIYLPLRAQQARASLRLVGR